MDDRSSRLQVSSRGPVVGEPGIPQCVGAQERQLAAHLDHIACLLDLHVVAQVGDDSLVPLVNHSCSAYELRRRQSGSARECTSYADDLRPIHALSMDTSAS